MLCLWLENVAEELYTSQDLELKMLEFSGGKGTYCAKWLNHRLFERYKDSLYFAEIDGRPNVVCFKTKTSSVLNEKWYKEQKCGVEGETEHIVERAAKIILSEIRALETNMEKYPSINDISDLAENDSIIPPYLKKF